MGYKVIQASEEENFEEELNNMEKEGWNLVNTYISQWKGPELLVIPILIVALAIIFWPEDLLVSIFVGVFSFYVLRQSVRKRVFIFKKSDLQYE